MYFGTMHIYGLAIPYDPHIPSFMVRCLSRWLTYHDKDTNGLPGMLLLAVGMRVALTHKMDESPEKRFLKHSVRLLGVGGRRAASISHLRQIRRRHLKVGRH